MLADRAAFWLVIIAIGTSVPTVIAWGLLGTAGITFAVARAVTVLVIACPHALGLAIPLVTMNATSVSARNGILGMVLYAHEQYEYAAPCFERAHVFDPGQGRWSYYLGRAQLFLARYLQAAASFRATLRLRPGYLPAEMKLAQTLLDADRQDEALALYQ